MCNLVLCKHGLIVVPVLFMRFVETNNFKKLIKKMDTQLQDNVCKNSMKSILLIIHAHSSMEECIFSPLPKELLMKILLISYMSTKGIIELKKKRNLCLLTKNALLYCPEIFLTLTQEERFLCIKSTAIKGKLEDIKKLIAIGIPEIIKEIYSIPYICAQEGRADMVKFFIKKNSMSPGHILSILYVSIKNRRENVLKVMHKAGMLSYIHQCTTGSKISSMLKGVCKMNIPYFLEDFMKELESMGIKGIDCLLHEFFLCAIGGHVDMLKIMIEKGFDIHTKRFSRTILMDMAKENRFNRDMFYFLIKKGIDINETEINGLTALYISILNGNHEMTMELINAGAFVDRGRVDNYPNILVSSMNLAIEEKSPFDIIEALYKRTSDEKESLFNHALLCGSLEAVTFFIENLGMDINTRLEQGQTPIMKAIKHYDTFVYIHKKGASLKKKDKYRRDIWHFVSSFGCKEVVLYLEMVYPKENSRKNLFLK